MQDSTSDDRRKKQYLHIFYILTSNLTNQGQNAVLAKPRGSPVGHWAEREMWREEKSKEKWEMIRDKMSRKTRGSFMYLARGVSMIREISFQNNSPKKSK